LANATVQAQPQADLFLHTVSPPEPGATQHREFKPKKQFPICGTSVNFEKILMSILPDSETTPPPPILPFCHIPFSSLSTFNNISFQIFPFYIISYFARYTFSL
jgi:hypothetical protein